MEDELATLEDGLDQHIAMWANIDEDIDLITAEAARTKDFEIIISGVLRYKALVQSSGVALAKMLYRAYQTWDLLEIEGDFFDHLSERVGIHRVTCKRYVSVWQMHEEKMIPPEVSDALVKRGVRYQINIASMVHQGYQPTEAQWDKLIDAPDTQTIGAIIREVKQVNPRKGTISLSMNRNGDIFVHTTNNRYPIGRLYLEKVNPDEMDAIYLGIRRIIESSHIMES